MTGEFPAIPRSDGSTGERREFRVVVPNALQQGWLAFQSGNERRRLAPIPQNWTELPDEELISLLAQANLIDNGRSR
jgi:hypothetical protein